MNFDNFGHTNLTVMTVKIYDFVLNLSKIVILPLR